MVGVRSGAMARSRASTQRTVGTMDRFAPAPRRLIRVTAIGLVAVAMLSGCGRGRGSAAAGSARDELRRAVEATLASKSFVMHVEVAGHPESEGDIVYQAPDRARKTSGATGVEIAVGHTMYSNMPSLGIEPTLRTLPEGSFWRFEAPRPDPRPLAQGYLGELRVLGDASEVTRVGSSYRYRAGTGKDAVSGDAHIDKGRVARFTFTPAGMNAVTTYSIADYDAAPAVEPPPANRVVDAPAVPRCGPDGSPPPGQNMCGGGDPSRPTTSTTVALPAPTVTGPSPLELRRVSAVEKGPCATVTAAYGAGEVRLDGPDGCYRLGTILATIRQADARPQAGPNGVTVYLDLSPSDGAAVRSALSGQFQRQVAMVMFSRVLSAPTVQDPNLTVDSIAVAPVDPQTAANIIRSLGR
jgi:hypothetical protein